MGEKGFDLSRPEVGRVALVVEQNEASNPIDVGLFGAQAVVFEVGPGRANEERRGTLATARFRFPNWS